MKKLWMWRTNSMAKSFSSAKNILWLVHVYGDLVAPPPPPFLLICTTLSCRIFVDLKLNTHHSDLTVLLLMDSETQVSMAVDFLPMIWNTKWWNWMMRCDTLPLQINYYLYPIRWNSSHLLHMAAVVRHSVIHVPRKDPCC